MATLPGSEQLRENHCRATCTIASQPLGVLTPSCSGSKISRARSMIKSTATLLVSRRIVSPIAIGLKDPLGLRRAMMEAPQTYGRISSGTSSLSRRLKKPEKQFGRSRAQRVAGCVKDGARTGPHQESKGTTGEPYEPGPHQPRRLLPARSAEECPSPSGLQRESLGEGGGEKQRRHPWDGPGMSCRSAAQARRRAPS